jgi:formyl-CoA transferase
MKPLDGIRVLDASRVVSGPVCCWFLAELGAEVIRVEPPGGDHTWRTKPVIGPDRVHRGDPGPRDIPISPLKRHRGKRSVVLNLKHEEGRALFVRLVRKCDVLVENAVPGAMERLGLDYASLEPENPRLVYCTITGYGHDGPYRERPSMDLVVQALSGIMAKTGFPDGPPTKVGVTIGDQVPALFAALGILAALRQCDVDGKGQLVDVAMLDCLLALLWDEPVDDFEAQGLPERVGNGDPRGAPLDVFQTRDGWAAVVLTQDAQWEKLCAEMGQLELATRFPDYRARLADRETINDAVADWCRTLETDDAVERLLALGIPAGPVRSPYTAPHDPQVRHRGSLGRLRHPDSPEPTDFLGAALPVRLSRGAHQTQPAETLGASTHAVLADLLGLSDEEIARLGDLGALS